MDKNDEQESVPGNDLDFDSEQHSIHEHHSTQAAFNENAYQTGRESTDKIEVDKIEAADVGDVLRGLVLQDTWHAVSGLRQRELGGFIRQTGPLIFANRTGGSVELVRRLKLHSKLDGHTGCVNALHFNESGSLLASGSDDLNIVVWKWTNSKPFYTFESGHRSNVFQCKFMPFTGDCHMVSCARDGHVRLAELSSTGTCKNTKKLTQHHGAAHKLALLGDSSHVFYSCGEDGVTFEIDLRQDKPNKLCTTKESSRRVELYSIHTHPFKSFEYCVSGRDPFVRIYDVRKIKENVDGGIVQKFCPEHLTGNDIKANVTCAVYNYNGSEVLASYNDEDIYLFNCISSESASSKYLHRYTGHRNSATVKGVNFYGPKSEFVVSGSDCGNVFLWDRQSEAIINFFHADDGGVVNVLEPHPNIPVLATSGLDHDVKIWWPSAENPTTLEGLEKLVRQNCKERDTERGEPDFDTHMFWMLMRHLRRAHNRRTRNTAAGEQEARQDNGDDDDDEDEGDGDGDDDDGEISSSDDTSDEDNETDEPPMATVRCSQS